MTITYRARDSRVGIARPKDERTSHLLKGLKEREVKVKSALLHQPGEEKPEHDKSNQSREIESKTM